MTTFMGYPQSLFDQPPHARFRKDDPSTSSEVVAKPEVARRLTENCRTVLRSFATSGNDGMNAFEVAQRCGLSRIEVSRRAPELERLGLVEKTGERRVLETGHMGAVRRVTAAGLLELRGPK